MKKTIFIIIVVAVLGLAFYYFNYIYGSKEFRKNTDTPGEYLNITVNKKDDYTKDSLAIVKGLKAKLFQHEYFFYSKEYFEGTEIIIDTILYSPDFNQLAILFLSKNPTSRQLKPTENEDFYYDASAYLGIREKDTISLSFLGPKFSNSSDRKELSKLMRFVFFRTYISKDTTTEYANKYNLNDIRFWSGNEWQKIEDDKKYEKELEEEKLKHPENIYEPKN